MKTKRILSLILSLVMILTMLPGGLFPSRAVEYAPSGDEGDSTSGLTPTTFGPDKTVTRAQMVTFLWRMSGRPEPKSKTNPFTDLDPNEYYYKAVLWAYETGITYGTSETTFSPNDPCTRAQIVAFLFRYFGKK